MTNTTQIADTRTTQMLLEQLQVVKLNIRLWTSSKKLRKEDLKLGTGATLPPETLASLGTKKTINPEQLKKFAAYKKEAERIVLATGTRFIGGFANPSAEIPRIVKELNDLSQLFEMEKERFLTEYANETQKWVDQHPEFSDAIRRAIEPVGSVRNKLNFDYMIFIVSKPDEQFSGPLERHTLSLGDQLYREISVDAQELFDRSFSGKDSVTGRSLGAFQRMRKKLDNLGFLDHRSLLVVQEIDRVLKGLPKAGPYKGSDFDNLRKLALLLSDTDCIKQFGSGQTPVLPVALATVLPVVLDKPIDHTAPVETAFDIGQLIIAAQSTTTTIDLVEPDFVEDDFLDGFDAFVQLTNANTQQFMRDQTEIPPTVEQPMVGIIDQPIQETSPNPDAKPLLSDDDFGLGVEAYIADTVKPVQPVSAFF